MGIEQIAKDYIRKSMRRQTEEPEFLQNIDYVKGLLEDLWKSCPEGCYLEMQTAIFSLTNIGYERKAQEYETIKKIQMRTIEAIKRQAK